MAIVTETIEIDVDAGEFDDSELIAELESRGYTVTSDGDENGFVTEAIFRWERKEYTEALFQLEKAFPELYGLTQFVRP